MELSPQYVKKSTAQVTREMFAKNTEVTVSQIWKHIQFFQKRIASTATIERRLRECREELRKAKEEGIIDETSGIGFLRESKIRKESYAFEITLLVVVLILIASQWK